MCIVTLVRQTNGHLGECVEEGGRRLGKVHYLARCLLTPTSLMVFIVCTNLWQSGFISSVEAALFKIVYIYIMCISNVCAICLYSISIIRKSTMFQYAIRLPERRQLRRLYIYSLRRHLLYVKVLFRLTRDF